MTSSTSVRETAFAVIGADGVYQSDGRVIPLPQFRQLGYWLDAATRRQIDSLWLHPSAGWRWTDDDIGACDPWIVAGSADDEKGNPWWTASKKGVYGIRDVVQPAYEDRAPWRNTTSARALRDALVAFRSAVGIGWRRSPGSTGLRLLRALHSGAHATRLELPGDPPPPALGGVSDAGPFYWTRAAKPNERRGYLHGFDTNGNYLAACSSLALGVGQWQHIRNPQLPGPREKKPLLPGYYFVRATEKALGGPCPPILIDDTGSWVTAPTLTLLRETRAALHVAECYVWPQSHRYLEPWYKTIREARAKFSDDSDPALKAIKGLYVHGIGWLATDGRAWDWDRSEDTLYRPDWAHHVRALAKANIHRTLRRVATNYGVYPLAAGNDCVYYVTDSPDPLQAPWIAQDGLRVSRQLGHFRVYDAGVPMGEVAEVVRGREWNLQTLQKYLNVRAGRRAA